MPDITDETAIFFSDTFIRPSADRIVRSYRRLDKLNEEWDASPGNNDAKFSLLQTNIAEVAQRVSLAYWFVARANLIWDELNLQSLFPNDTSAVIDGAGPAPTGDGRAAITGQDVRRCQNRMDEFQQWLDQGSFDIADLIDVTLTAATFTTATKNLTQTGAFSSYTHNAGDVIYINGGTGVTTGVYSVASKTDNDTIVLSDDIGGTDPSDVTSSSSAVGNDTYLRHMIRMSHDGSKAPTTAWGRTVAVDRADDIKTEYEVTHTAKYNQLLLCSVNGES
jgi:hypothetical protein